MAFSGLITDEGVTYELPLPAGKGSVVPSGPITAIDLVVAVLSGRIFLVFRSSTTPRSATFRATALSAGVLAGLERLPVGGSLNRSNRNIWVRIRLAASLIVAAVTWPSATAA